MENRVKNPKTCLTNSWTLYFLFIFFVGFIVFFPLPVYSIINPQEKLSSLVLPCIQWVGITILHIKEPFTIHLLSDSTGLYIFVFILLFLSFLLSIVWIKTFPVSNKKLTYWLKVILSYYLSFILFVYGINKLFKIQFYLPEPNTLFTPLGFLSKDILLWSTLGSSYSYNIVIGIAQIIPAVLLLFKNTRMIGGSISFILFVNILILNLTFDISVKLFSTFLLLISLCISFPVFKSIYLQFYKKSYYSYIPWFPQWKKKTQLLFYIITKSFVIGCILFESLFIYFKTGIFNGDTANKNPLFGAYLIENTNKNNFVKRIFFHSRQYFILQNTDDQFTDFKIIDMTSSKLTIQDYKENKYLIIYKTSGDSIFLQGKIASDSLLIKGIKINLEELPLLQEQFHFTLDNIK